MLGLWPTVRGPYNSQAKKQSGLIGKGVADNGQKAKEEKAIVSGIMRAGSYVIRFRSALAL